VIKKTVGILDKIIDECNTSKTIQKIFNNMERYNSPYTFLKGPNITNAYECKSICDCRAYAQFKVEPAGSYNAAHGTKTGPLWSTPQECAL
jgi:hypothetical protein